MLLKRFGVFALFSLISACSNNVEDAKLIAKKKILGEKTLESGSQEAATSGTNGTETNTSVGTDVLNPNQELKSVDADSPVEQELKREILPKEEKEKILDKPKTTFSEIEVIVQQNCLGCHSSGQQPILSSLKLIEENREAVFLAVESGRMPPGGFPESKAARKKTLLEWLKKGQDFESQMKQSVYSAKIARLNPEQLSLKLKYNLNYKEGYTSGYTKKFVDTIVKNKGIALGGKDNDALTERNPSTGIQTILTVNTLSSKIGWSLSNEWDKEKTPRLFTVCRAHECWPFLKSEESASQEKQDKAKEREKLWEAQLTDIFYKFYNRKPTAEEVAKLRALFLKTIDLEKEVQEDMWIGSASRNSWAVLLYGMIKSVEFWHY